MPLLSRTGESTETNQLASRAIDLSADAPDWLSADHPYAIAELHSQLRAAIPEETVLPHDRPGQALGKVLAALGNLQGEALQDRILQSAAPELCAAGVFDHVMFSLIRGTTWLPQTLYVFDPTCGARRELNPAIEGLAVTLGTPHPEAEVVRRRLPALVESASTPPQSYRPVTELIGVTNYVVAPIVNGSSVIGLLHADTAHPLSSVERDLLRLFADGVGLIYECAGLKALVEQQRSTIADTCDTAMRAMQELDTVSQMGTVKSTVRGTDFAVRPAAPAKPGRIARLTPREYEVLALLASGATNSQLADQLTVAESTIKSHIKSILRKLGTGNRAGAISCYMRESRKEQRWPR